MAESQMSTNSAQPKETSKIDTPYASPVVGVLRTYFQLAQGGSAYRQRLIQDATLKAVIAGYGVDPSPQVALYICKILIVLSDSRHNAHTMACEGYIEMIGTLCEQQQLPPKLLTKFWQVQTRLTKAQTFVDAAGDEATEVAEKRTRKKAKEFTFVLPTLNESQQHAISKAVLAVKDLLSVSFCTYTEKHETHCIVRCRADVEAKSVADAIMNVDGFDTVGYVLTNEDGSVEIFTFYPDENAAVPKANLPQYLDDNVDVYDPTRAVTTVDYKTCAEASGGGGWLSTATRSFFGFW